MSLPGLNPLSAPALGLALDGAARPKSRRSPNIASYRAELTRVAKKAPEVLVKVSGTGKRSGQILAHMTYITRNGKLEAENERGQKVNGLEEVKQVFGEWGFQLNDSERRRAQTVNIVLSMPEGTDAQAVLAASRGFAKESFGDNHQYLLALHTDTKQPHVHLSVKAQGFDLTWLRRSKADLQEWREVFAQQMRDQGVEAEATPRRARGVTQKSATQSMYHLGREPKRSTVIQAKVDDMIREIDGQKPPCDRPWERAIAKRQQKIRGAYTVAAAALREAKNEVSRKAASQLSEFLKNLTPIETERVELKRQLDAMMAAERVRTPDQNMQRSTRDREALNPSRARGQSGREK